MEEHHLTLMEEHHSTLLEGGRSTEATLAIIDLKVKIQGWLDRIRVTFFFWNDFFLRDVIVWDG